MATHSSILAWKIQWMKQLGRLQSMWSQRVRHNLATKLQTIDILTSSRPTQKVGYCVHHYMLYFSHLKL